MVEEVKNVRTENRSDEATTEILREYDDGTKLIGIILVDDISFNKNVSGYHDRYRIVAADGQSRDIVGGMNMDRRRVAQELASLFHRFGYIVGDSADMVPVEIAVSGKPAIAAYLNAVHNISLEEVAEKLGVKWNTAYQYVDHFKEGRR